MALPCPHCFATLKASRRKVLYQPARGRSVEEIVFGFECVKCHSFFLDEDHIKSYYRQQDEEDFSGTC